MAHTPALTPRHASPRLPSCGQILGRLAVLIMLLVFTAAATAGVISPESYLAVSTESSWFYILLTLCLILIVLDAACLVGLGQLCARRRRMLKRAGASR